jgi:hypothetical protein
MAGQELGSCCLSHQIVEIAIWKIDCDWLMVADEMDRERWHHAAFRRVR